MTKPQRENISRLIEKVSRRTSTEDLIAFVADNFGMLLACQKVVDFREASATEERTWFEQQCHDLRIAPPVLQNECERILSIFQPGLAEDEQYSLLGLTPLASIAEVKSAYHKLSFRYHPDSAAVAADEDKAENAEKFIAICRAYKKIAQAQENLNAGAKRAGNIPWQHEARPRSPQRRQQKRKAILLIAAIAVFLLIISFSATHHYRKKAMLKSLGQSSGTVAAVKSRPRPISAAPPAVAKSEKSQPVKVAAAPETAAKSENHEKPQPVKVAAVIPPAPVSHPETEPVEVKSKAAVPAPRTPPPPVKVAAAAEPVKAEKSVKVTKVAKVAPAASRASKPEPVKPLSASSASIRQVQAAPESHAPVKKAETDVCQIFKTVQNLIDKPLQIGGNATVGRGLCQLRME